MISRTCIVSFSFSLTYALVGQPATAAGCACYLVQSQAHTV
jgi:hypothetical protein